ncbi:hypothetical protein ACOSQ4_023270 [Xanthoceras sorbifolium]
MGLGDEHVRIQLKVERLKEKGHVKLARSTREGNKTCRTSLAGPCSSDSSVASSWWRFLWQLYLPAKVKVFLWKASHDWLPSFSQLFERKVVGSTRCSLCFRAVETPFHAVWFCKSLETIRADRAFLAFPPVHGDLPILDFFLSYKSLNALAQFELLAVVWWRAWFRRNKLVHNEVSFSVADIVPWSRSFLSEFQSSRFASAVRPSVAMLRGHNWRPPKVPLLNINCDAALSVVDHQVGLGVVIRDCCRRVKLSAACSWDASLDPSVAEVIAIRFGMQLAVDHRLSLAVVESDAQTIINLIRAGISSHYEIRLLVDDIVELKANHNFSNFVFSLRDSNRVAHNLAKMATIHAIDFVLVEDVPSGIRSLV